jgi:hypothetical protein
VLARGRPGARRVLAASSPLYQSLAGAEALGYEVRVYARVLDTGDGADRAPHPRHARRGSAAASGPDSDAQTPGSTPATGSSTAPAPTHTLPVPARRRHQHTQSLGAGGSAPSSAGTSPAARPRMREQGVDELLQLKVHQALAAAPDPAPAGATIVLATGDGNVGQFNEEGFTGCVRTALRKGWRVELYAWEDGLARGWRREFGGDARFRVVALEKFAGELVETPEPTPA